MAESYRYTGDQPLNVTADTVFETVKAIMNAGLEDKFLAECRDRGATIVIAPQFVNLVKDYLFKNDVHKMNTLARDVIRSARCTPG